MPRSPIIATQPPGTTPQVPNTVISSAVWNAAIDDIYNIFNTVQPVQFGGTGGTSAISGSDAMNVQGANIASATTTDLALATGTYILVTGNTTITAFGTSPAGAFRRITFTGTPTLTYNSTSLILPTGSNITVRAGDSIEVVSLGSGNWRVINYQGSNDVILAETLRNRVVNGDKTVSQENGQTAGTTNGYYVSDQNAVYRVTSAGTITAQNVLTISPAGGYRDRITITVADASLAAGEYLTYTQNLEGSNVRDLKWGDAGAVAAVARMGFKGPAGTYAYRLGNSAANRSYVALFTISGGEANTDVVREFAIPGDTTGTWLNGDGVIGITRDIVLAAGSTFQGAAGWQGGKILGTSGISNGMGTGGAVFEFFDEGFKADPDATGVYGAYEVGEVDAVYQGGRYVSAAFVANGVGASGTTIVSSLSYGPMCKIPTIAATAGVTFTDATSADVAQGPPTITINDSTTRSALVSFNGFTSTITPNRPYVLRNNGVTVRAFARLS